MGATTILNSGLVQPNAFSVFNNSDLSVISGSENEARLNISDLNGNLLAYGILTGTNLVTSGVLNPMGNVTGLALFGANQTQWTATTGMNTAVGDIINTVSAHRHASDLGFYLGALFFNTNDSFQGNQNDNVLMGFAGADSLVGGAGNDILNGGLGADSLDGGAGVDLASYADAFNGVAAFLTTGFASSGEATGDTYISIEGLIGSSGSDLLGTSVAGGNQLWGGSGNDQLFAFGGHNYINGGGDNDSIFSVAGSNTIDGGTGFDLVRYDYALFGVVAALDPSASPYNTGAAAGDTYTAVEGLGGSSFNDVLFGDAGGNQLYGQNGNDFLIGNAGDDVLFGGSGANELLGGAGSDAFDFYSSELQVGVKNTIDDFSFTSANTDHLYLFGVSSGDVSFVPLANGTNINIAMSAGIATIFASGASLANVETHTSFF